HMTLLPSGEVLGWDDHTENQGMYLWNPSTAAFVTFPPHSVNLFCSGHTALPDGKILITGGMGVTFNIGIRNTGLYDPQLRTLSATGSMRYARYYPTVISLSDGRCLVLSGTDGCGTCVQEIPEIFNPSTGAWTELPAAGINIPYYPHVFLLPNGRILTCGTSEASVPTRVLDLATQSWTVLDSSSESGGSAAMFLPGRILRSGRANPPGIDEAASAATQVMDATVPSPVWRTTTPMAFPRTHHNLTILPDGTVLVTGGGRNSAASAIDEAVHEAEVWSPGTEAWSTLAAMQTPRLYHGTSLLLPDGRVLVAGSGRPTGFGGVDQFSAEIYSPPYLFRGPRPVIDSSPVAVPHGTSFFVGTPDASRISKISLVRLGSVTHAFNQDQRYLPLTFQPAAGGLTVQAPVDPRVAPPGYYMLFLVDNVGVPSLSAMVRMSTAVEDLTPPSAPGTPAAVVATGSVSLSWTAASDNVAVVNYHVHRSTTPGFAASGANRIAETPSTAFTDLGIQASGFYYYRITALDAAGNVGPPSGEREVAPVPDTTPPSVPQNPVLTVISPNRIDLSWDASSDDLGVAGYRVFRDSVQIASVSNVSFSDVTVSPLTTYAYSITAFDSAGNSSQPSVSVNATTPSASSGLVAAYGFNEGGGATVTDASGNGNTGTISGATWSAQGKSGGALSFDGASSLVVINDSSSLDLTTGMTLEAWVFPEASQSGWRTVIQKEVDTYLLHAGSVSPLVPATGATYSGDVTWIAGSGSIAVGQWTHLAGTYDGTRVRLYVNGVEVASAARTGLISVNDLPVRIGGNSPYGEHFDGLIDEVRIYNRALSATEIQSDMNPNTAAPVLTAPGNQISVVGNAVSRQMQATDPNGDLLTWSASGLPPGLSIDPSTGLISGIPTTVGVYSSTVTVTDGNTAPVSRGFTWTINNVLTLQPLAGSAVVAGSSIVLTAQSAGGLNPQFSWNFDDGTPDTVFSSSPTVSHTFTNPGRYLVTVTARDDTGREVTSRYRQAIHAPLTASRPTASSSIAYEDRTGANDRLWVVNPDNDSVTVFDAVTRARLAEVNVGRAPRTLAIGPDGRVWVVNAESATITILTSTFSLSQTVNLPRGSRPYGVVFDPAGVNAYVALEDGGRILKLNPANGATAASLDVGLHVRHLSVTADGALILASRFVSPRLPGEETASPQTTVGGVKHGGEVLAISAGTFTVDETVVLEHSEAPDLAISAKGIPNYLGAAVISPDGLSAWVPSKQDNIKRGALRNGGPLTHDMTMRSIVSRIVLASQSEDITGRIDFDNAGIGSASAFDAKGVFLFTALEGSREIAVVDAWAKQEVLRFDAGRAPQGLVLAPDGRALFVHNFMDRTVTLHDLNGLANGADGQPPAPVVLNCVTTEKLTPQVLVGKQLFYDASDRRLAFERYISCAGCHNDGGQDGRIWDFTQFGEGLRNTIALRGRGGVAHGPLHWTGNFDEVQDFEGQIRNFALGTGLMSDTDFHAGTRSQPLGDPKSGLSADLDALAAYVSSLTAHGDSPDRNADGSFTSAALAGQAVFQQQNCAQCHAGSKFTDSALNVFHDVGTLKPSSGQRLGAALPGMDTPTVLGLWGTAPYLHDGSAATLEEAVSAHNGVALNAADLSNLVAFLLQLDDTGTAAPAIVTWASPAAITYGTALSGTQLNATANTPGTFDYAPPAGTVLSAGNGQTLSVTFTPTDTANYGPATATVAINVLKAPLAITADDKSRPYGQPNPPFTAAYTGFVNGDTAASLDSPVVLNTTANQSSPEGTYSIVASGAADANYAVTFINGTLTVTAPVGTPGLVAAYGFNEGAGATVTDASVESIIREPS
ncbi:MAG TPA: LamG-like jellyroll fold domain-containing protein, partial [Verrucomicrobiae bacterium]|nr:LamG-like jellyroll fold domain-containing protein [Verrucomicrobiae bacterium]